MKDNLLRNYLDKPSDRAQDNEPPINVLDDLGAFGFLRGTHDRALMLELRHKDGNIEAFPYAWLSKASFDPYEGITLRFGAEVVKVNGRNLNAELRPNLRLFAALVRQRVPWIQEAGQPQAWKAGDAATVIEDIKVK